MVFPESFPLHIWRVGGDPSAASSFVWHKPRVPASGSLRHPRHPSLELGTVGLLKGSHMR